MAKAALGKGLGALISPKASGTAAPQEGEVIQRVPLTEIVPTPLQPRKDFKPESLVELIDSVRERGIIQPLIVRRVGAKFELIAGERRWRAATEVGLADAPVIVRSASDLEVLELALVENLQREDLNPMEEAQAYARLAREFNLRQEEISRKVGKSRATVANSMRLLDLHPDLQSWVAQGLLTVGHAKVLLAVKNQDEQRLLAEPILRNGATVRTAERIVAAHLARTGNDAGRKRRGTAPPEMTPALQHLQNRLRQHLATHVAIHHGTKKGRLEIEYYGNDDLDRIAGLLGLAPND